MKLISHRGNLSEKNSNKENKPEYILKALENKFDVEIDVWYLNENWYLGHDQPQYKIEYDFLKSKKLWLHAKNGDAFYNLLNDKKNNVFYHTDEDWVLTSKKYIWTYPNQLLYPNSICVLPEKGYLGNLKNCYGICSDYIIKYQNL